MEIGTADTPIWTRFGKEETCEALGMGLGLRCRHLSVKVYGYDMMVKEEIVVVIVTCQAFGKGGGGRMDNDTKNNDKLGTSYAAL